MFISFPQENVWSDGNNRIIEIISLAIHSVDVLEMTVDGLHLVVEGGSELHPLVHCLQRLKFLFNSVSQLGQKSNLMIQHSGNYVELVPDILGLCKQRHLIPHVHKVVVKLGTFLNFTLATKPFLCSFRCLIEVPS